MISEGGGRAVVIAPSALGSKDHPAGPSIVPLRRILQAIYPPRRIRRRDVEEKAPWRVSRHDNLPSSPSMASRNEVWKTEGVSTFSFGVLVTRTWYPNHLPVLVVIELELHQTSKEMEPETKRNNTSSRYTNFQWLFASRLDVCTLLLTRQTRQQKRQTDCCCIVDMRTYIRA